MIEQRLEETRRRLLDLSRANRLLNHRPRGQRTLCIWDEVPASVYAQVAESGQTMQFLSREEAPDDLAATLPREEDLGRFEEKASAPVDSTEPAPPTAAPAPPAPAEPADKSAAMLDTGPQPAIETSPAAVPESEASSSPPPAHEAELPLAPIAANGNAERHNDRYLQTLLSGEKLQARLVNLAREARSALEEQGCNILFLTLGIVEWREPDPHSPVCRAPLIFIPVELHRKNVQSRYSLKLFDDEVLTNPCLAELCQRSFQFELPLFDPEGEIEISAYLDQVRAQIDGLSGWRYRPEVNLGLFSFSKLLMYRDLDAGNWPDNSRLADHPLVQALLGEAAPPDGGGIPDPTTLDETVKPADTFQVVDADSSQQAAILAARQGASMVIEGPPGTGKSQTITNIIAECLAAGKSVLFVAEKSAALDVVKRRLSAVGLGDFVMELHSRKASKKLVLQELQRVLDAPDKPAAARPLEAQELEGVRRRLNDYPRELHTPLGALNLTPFEAIGRTVALADQPEAECPIPQPLDWNSQQFAEAQEKLRTLDNRLARVGDYHAHPWRGTGAVPAGLESRQMVRGRCEQLGSSIEKMLADAAALASLLGMPAPATVAAAEALLSDASTLFKAPALQPGSLLDERWNALSADLQQWLNTGAQRQQLRTAWSQQFKPEAELLDWKPLLQRRDAHKASVLRYLRPSWHRDNKLLRANSVREPLPGVEQQLSLLQAIIRSGELRRSVEEQSTKYADLFGSLYHGPDSEWPALRQVAESAVAVRQLILRQAVQTAAAQRLVVAERRPELADALAKLTESQAALATAWQAWMEALRTDEKHWLKADWKKATLAEIRDRLRELPGRLDALQDWVDFHNATRACLDGPLSSFAHWALTPAGDVARGRLAETFSRHFHRLWLDAAIDKCPALSGFRGEDHQNLIQRFRSLDTHWIEATRQRLSTLLATRRPDGDYNAHRQSKLGIVQMELRKKSRHMPLRKLFAAAGDVIQVIKPCFMMSPLSVAQYLAPGCTRFDVVIFDEASQVEPADAFGAVARGGQLVLVGDDKQLPPTSFFSRIDDGDDAESDEGQATAADLESVLSLGAARLPNRLTLRWHYRSRHASLIDFSNQKFYESRLRVFPSPHTDCRELGLSFRFIENATYLRGSGRFNPTEARAVAEAVARHAIESPRLSLGVGTLNLPQQQAIEDEIERIRRQSDDPRLEQFFTNHEDEPFFVKNLENIQGDERDVILLSVGYGRDANGRFYASFGPLNADGGWRRLNVLVTRARMRCTVFSSIHSDDIAIGPSAPRGVVALKEYLYAAEKGRLADAAVPGAEHQSPFEAVVCKALRDRNWEVHPQVGCAGFAIDLGVVDPRRPGRYLLGIECDGATYHSSPTARDRDRLRQSVLENLGWTLERIWSTDFFQRPGQVMERLLQRLEELKEEPLEPAPAPATAPTPAPAPVAPQPAHTDEAGEEDPRKKPARRHEAEPASEIPEGVIPYPARHIKARGNAAALSGLAPQKLAGVLVELLSPELPLHEDEAQRILAEAYETRVTPRLRETFARGLAAAGPRLVQRGEFLYSPGDAPLPPRWRGDEECPVTRPELIPPAEIAAATRLALGREFGLKEEALVESALHLIGFARISAKLRQAGESALKEMLDRGEVVADNAGFLVLKES